MILAKEKKWFLPMVDFDEESAPAKKSKKEEQFIVEVPKPQAIVRNDSISTRINNKNWIQNFDPVNIEDLAVHNKKIQEIDDWLNLVHCGNCSSMLLLSGPVGCGKTTTLHTLCAKYHIKVTEWITPLDIEIPSHNGQYEFIEKQSKQFLDFIISSANYTSLLDNNNRKLVLVEDFPNTFTRTPLEFTDVLLQYKQRAKSPIVFICSESHSDNKNSALNLFTPTLKEQFKIHHIVFNGVSITGLRAALKRVSDIINKKYTSIYNTPTADLIECVVNSSGGDVRSAVLNLHFAALKGSTQNLETSVIVEKEKKKTTTRKKKQASSKFMSIGKNETVSILHGVGRVLNPKVINNKDNLSVFSHSPKDVIEQFISQPNSFVNFLEENYLSHFSSVDHADKASSALSDADFMLAVWGEKMCQEYGLYIAVAGLMTANKSPVSAWNPVRGPKNMRIQYPTTSEIPLLDQDYLYKGKTLVADYKTYCKIIASSTV